MTRCLLFLNSLLVATATQASAAPPAPHDLDPLTEVEAAVELPTRVTAGAHFEAGWTGPALEFDLLSVHTADEPLRSLSYGYTRRGNPVQLVAPMEAGDYLVSYVRGKRRLATAVLDVAPAPRAGFLEVQGSSTRVDTGAVEIILDASGSMLQKLGALRRIEIAREAVATVIRDEIPAGTPFALRVFGHREADGCRTDLEIPLAPLDPLRALPPVADIQPMKLAKRPIAASLAHSVQDLSGATGARILILVTDGEETCDGDPATEIRALRDAASDVQLNIVGFGIDETALEQQFRLWAGLGNGIYLSADDATQLTQALRDALRRSYEVIDFEGRTVATGIIGDEKLELPPGTYQLQWRDGPELRDAEVHVQGGETTTHRIADP